MVREMVGFSVFVLILNVGGQLTFETDAIVIAAFLPVDAIPKFSIASSLSVYLINFMIAIGSVVMPLAAARQAQANMSELRDVFLKWSKIAVGITLFCCLYLMVLGPSFLGWWVGPDFEKPAGQVLRILMAGNLLFLPVRGLCLPVLMGLGKPRLVTLTFFGISLVNLAMSVALARPLGLAGVAIGTAVPNAVFAIATLVLACRELEVPLRDYMRYVVLRPVIAAVPLVTFLLWIPTSLDVHRFGGLFAAGIAALILDGGLYWAYVFRRDHLLNPQAWFGQLRLRRP
jgi:O-antigen/teichoic acid export membrane protein